MNKKPSPFCFGLNIRDYALIVKISLVKQFNVLFPKSALMAMPYENAKRGGFNAPGALNGMIAVCKIIKHIALKKDNFINRAFFLPSMVFIDVYDAIWKFLEKEELLDEALLMAEAVCGKKTISRYNGTEMLPDIVLENALFGLEYKGDLLIDYAEKKLFPGLDEEDKKEFLLLKASKRENLSFVRKEKLNRKDTHGKDLYKFYFRNKKGEAKEVLSSSALEGQGKELNMRLLRLPEEEGEMHAVIGFILNAEAMDMLELLKRL